MVVKGEDILMSEPAEADVFALKLLLRVVL